MTEIERKALALVNEVERQEGLSDLTPQIMRGLVMDEALCRAIEQHEAFKQEVSDAVEKHKAGMYLQDIALDRFILPKPVDPLLEAVGDAMEAHEVYSKYELTESIRAIGKARGYEWRKIEGEG